jgi:phospholipid/cholesterol/gamma-HCH transport system ATP-binding protein
MASIIEVRNFAKRFGNKIVHRDVNLEVMEGQCVGLIGGSGAGKSVILRSLIGLERPDAGKVIVLGQDLNSLKEKELIPLRQKVAYVFQGGALFDSMTVADNLAYPLREHTQLSNKEIQKKVTATLNAFDLPGSEKVMPAELSGGMQKRVGLARAIILDPQVVLFDEPTAGLDPYNTKQIQSKILELKKRGVTSILVTHDMPTASAVCDHLFLLLDGKIAAEGTPIELLTKKGQMSQFINGERE